MRRKKPRATRYKPVSPSTRSLRAWLHGLSWFPGAWLLVERKNARIMAASKQAQDLIGDPKERYVGQSITILRGYDDAGDASLKRLDPKILEREGRYEDIGLKRADGSVIGVDVQISHLKNGAAPRLAICLLTDRTEQRRLTRELIAKHQELRREYSRLQKAAQNSTKEL